MNVSIQTRERIFVGFILPKKKKRIFSDIENVISIPTALLFSKHGVLTEYWIQSFECFKEKNYLKNEEVTCKCCKLFWRNLKGLSPKETVLLSDYNNFFFENQKL